MLNLFRDGRGSAYVVPGLREAENRFNFPRGE
jgi:hypothetical protein